MSYAHIYALLHGILSDTMHYMAGIYRMQKADFR